MPEQYIRIDGADGNGIYGKLRSSGQDRLVIHIHGLTRSMNDMLEVTSADFFARHGYDHYRVGLYAREPDSRNLAKSTLSTHVKDIQSVLEHFQDRYQEIFITAHSLGGLCALILNPQNIRAMSLWDPSTDITNFWASGSYLTHMPERGQYQLDYGNVYVLGQDMVEEIKQYPDERCLELSKAVSTPTQMVIPELSIFAASPHISPENYRHSLGGPFALKYLDGADHIFSSEDSQQVLFQATCHWFDQFDDR